MNCPICNVTLQITQRQDIEIDFCPQCRGVWLDRGELDKIIERSAATIPGQPNYVPNQHYDKHHDKHHHDQYYGRHKKRSFLGDLFD